MVALKYITFVVCLCFGACVFGQISFQKTYGSNGFEKVSRVIQSQDSGYVVIGSSGLTGASSDVYILKVDSLGNYLWSKFYGGANVEHGTDIIETPDSGFAISGYTNSSGAGGYDAYLLKLDKDGNFEWDMTYGGSDWDFAHAIDVMPDSGYVLVGETYSYGAGNNDVYVIRTDKLGNVIWDQVVGTAGNDVGKDFILTTFGSVILAGTTNGRGAGGNDVFAVRINTLGDTIWTKTYGTALDEECNAIKTMSQFNYYNMAITNESATNGSTNLQFIGINGSGTTINSKEFVAAENVTATDIAIRNPNDQLIVGTIEDPIGGINYVGYYANYQGLFLQAFSFGTFGEDACKSAIHTYDDGFLLAGTSEQYSVGGTDIYLVKIGPSPTFDNTSGIDDQFQDFTDINDYQQIDVSIHPNPAKEYVIITTESHKLQLRIYDLAGALIKADNISSGLYNIADLQSGIYIFELLSEEGLKTTKKVVVNH